MSTDIAANVRAEMARAGVTQVQMAAALGITQQAVSKRVTGAVDHWSVPDLRIVAKLCGCSLATLIGELTEAAS